MQAATVEIATEPVLTLPLPLLAMTSAEDYASQRQACSIPPVTDSTITVSSATDLFRSDGLFDSRKLPTPSLMYAANFTPPDHGTTSPTIHRPSSSWQRTSSVSSQDSGYFTTLSMQSSVDTLEPNITAVPNGPTRSSLSMSKSGQVPTREAQRQGMSYAGQSSRAVGIISVLTDEQSVHSLPTEKGWLRSKNAGQYG